MIITTSGRPGKASCHHVEIARRFFKESSCVNREKRSIKALYDQYQDDILVAGEKTFELFKNGVDDPFFYHPNSASFRIKRMMKGEKDPLIEAADLLPEDSFLDCTAGMASDSLVASWYCGPPVTAIERNKEIAFITGQGLKSFQHKIDDITLAMRRIQLIHEDAYSFLLSAPSDSYDVIYFDPMFTETIESKGITPLKRFAERYNDDLYKAISEAKRVARKKVLLKDHFRSSRFEEMGFQRLIRPSTKQHYGIISIH
ncbi:class I SAM-dependent methyltransferase [Jeotgalibacillus sp. JSM ZJ347]|uniref:class I SAM-dependent methyltransferase n=1 Tax=Jeotgalibacillus sp. JSM ZJ347 TaxID=3342117 RepID=UPI0035A937A5